MRFFVILEWRGFRIGNMYFLDFVTSHEYGAVVKFAVRSPTGPFATSHTLFESPLEMYLHYLNIVEKSL